MKIHLPIATFLILSTMSQATLAQQGLPAQETVDLCEHLNYLQQEHTKLSAQLVEEHPQLIMLREKIEHLTSLIVEQYPDVAPDSVCETHHKVSEEYSCVVEREGVGEQ